MLTRQLLTMISIISLISFPVVMQQSPPMIKRVPRRSLLAAEAAGIPGQDESGSSCDSTVELAIPLKTRSTWVSPVTPLRMHPLEMQIRELKEANRALKRSNNEYKDQIRGFKRTLYQKDQQIKQLVDTLGQLQHDITKHRQIGSGSIEWMNDSDSDSETVDVMSPQEWWDSLQQPMIQHSRNPSFRGFGHKIDNLLQVGDLSFWTDFSEHPEYEMDETKIKRERFGIPYTAQGAKIKFNIHFNGRCARFTLLARGNRPETADFKVDGTGSIQTDYASGTETNIVWNRVHDKFDDNGAITGIMVSTVSIFRCQPPIRRFYIGEFSMKTLRYEECKPAWIR